MYTWGRIIATRARLVLVGGLLLVATAAVYGVGVFDSLSDGGFDDPASESSRALATEQDVFGNRGADVVALYSSDTLRVDDPAFRHAVTGTLDDLPAGAVDRVASYYDSPDPGLVSEDGRTTRLVITLAGEGQDAKSTSWEAVADHLDAPGLRTDVGGQWAVFGDVNSQVSEDIARAETLTMPLVFLLSLLIFGSVVAALMPTLIGAVAVLGAFAVVRLITGVTDVSVFSINVITLLGMGLAIDYALFVVNRFREELAAQPDDSAASSRRAVARTMATAGRTVLFSGLIVAASLASLLIFPQTFLRSMGYGGVAAVLVAMTAALTLLPALLAVLGRRVELGRMPWRRRPAGPAQPSGAQGGWARVARSVMRRPVVYLVAITVGLLVLAAPFAGARWGSVDERVLPADMPSRVAADLMAERFGGETSSARIVVEGADRGETERYLADLEDLAGMRAVQLVGSERVDGAPVSLVEATWSGNGQTEASQDLLRDIRAVDPGDGVEVQVGGPTAAAVDLVASVGSHLPWMGLLVVTVMLVLLFVAFGSVVLPVKAVVMNVLSIGASFGVVTWIFQEGNLSGPLGFTSPGYLDVTQPILMLAILFGLSMDYEVFLLSRVREEWDRSEASGLGPSRRNTDAVAAGVQRTGRIITSAALLLAVVIGGFATSGIVFLKMIGIGMLVAVLLDATVVRALLVPATMRLLGPLNWWAPGPLKRWWERHGHREQPAPRPVDAAEPDLVGAR